VDPNSCAITADDACRALDESPFAAWWGLRVGALGNGVATVILPSAPHLMRRGAVTEIQPG
jgi:hypothetical protein